MKEKRLKDYFQNKVSAEELNVNLIGTAKAAGAKTTAFHINDMDEEFEVVPDHIIKLCQDVVNGLIEPEHLESIAFCLIASDNFYFGGTSELEEEVKGVLSEWASPEINYQLNRDNIEKCLQKLENLNNK